jgi:hypothetical protein
MFEKYSLLQKRREDISREAAKKYSPGRKP